MFAYSTTARTPPCLMLSLICILLVCPLFVLILAVMFSFNFLKNPADYKGGGASIPSNYRPISLTSIMMKILERVIRKQINIVFYD